MPHFSQFDTDISLDQPAGEVTTEFAIAMADGVDPEEFTRQFILDARQLTHVNRGTRVTDVRIPNENTGCVQNSTRCDVREFQ